MSSHLWKAYFENDVLSFQSCLAAGRAARAGGGAVKTTPAGNNKADVNARDNTGQTLLHHVASSTADTAFDFACALVHHPLTDLYLQDYENGWTALHRAFYFGNVTVARVILERDAAQGLVRVKDKEGNGPLDLYAVTIKDRTLRPDVGGRRARAGSDASEEEQHRMIGDSQEEDGRVLRIPFVNVNCDQLFTFGSNKNVSLGFGDEDDRQFPERINVRRPEHLVRRFYTEHLEQHERKWTFHDPTYRPEHVDVSELWVEDIPWMPKSKPLTIQDVQMSKLHSAVLTSDPESNLYICGHGPGGRLGTGDELTRFHFVCIESGALAGKRVATVALGLNHTLALSEDGGIFSWGNNGYGQLGYSLPKTSSSDEDPISAIPRQIFGPLKREVVSGIAASRIHSVAHTGSSLFTFGKNEGQLGIVDSDARSLETQTTPRKVAASLFASNITAVAAMDKATVCLLESHDVWVFANYGYAKVQFPLEGFTNYFLKQSFLVTTYDQEANRIAKVTCGGDTICALSSRGEIYTFSINSRTDNPASASTTNPTKIRTSIMPPQCIWSPKKNNMAARDVGVDADGSIILSTEEGSVWKRTKRVKIKDATASTIGEYKPKDYKFSRIPGLTRVLAVRASAFGAYAAIRRDCDATKTQIVVEDPRLWKDLLPLLSLKRLAANVGEDELRHRFWQSNRKPDELQLLKRAVLESEDVEGDLVDLEERCFGDPSTSFDAVVGTTTSDVRIPVHRFVLTGRSRAMRRGFRDLCETSTFTIADLAVSEIDENGRAVVVFQGLDILTVIDLVLYLYTDTFVDFWHLTRNAPKMAHRYRQVRTELMRVATKLELGKLEPAARQMVQPLSCLDIDFEIAFADPAFFYDGDVVVQLEDDDVRVHSALVRARCPFFEGLFMGHAGGRWLAGREEEEEISVDLKHINSKTFQLVLRHIYADTGAELFDGIVGIGVDDFLDAVMDVLSVANELMLDRLSQICQEVIGRFVNVRNVCGLLNAISPSSVHEFKDAALEYLCLSLEAMLQGHHLNELDEDLLFELDNIVRENQLACMPFAKSGRAEMLLHERHPELASAIERNRRAKIDSASLRSKYLGIEQFAPGSVGDELSTSPSQQKARRKSSHHVKPETPSLKAKASAKDMIFAMDDEFERPPTRSPSIRPKTLDPISSSPPTPQQDARSLGFGSPGLSSPATPRTPLMSGKSPPNNGQPWSLTPLTAPKTDMKDIMAQAAANRTSSLSQSLAASRAAVSEGPSTMNLPPPKMSQKDRKRLQHAQPSSSPEPESSTGKASPAWQSVGAPKISSLKDAMDSQSSGVAAKPVASRASSTPQLTMRQTVANPKPGNQTQKQAIGPSGQNTVQQRSASEQKPSTPEQRRAPPPPPQQQQPSNSKPIPQSIRHQPPPDPVLGLSMSEIVAQQQLEKDVVKEAVAKRDLQDIQAEQEFEEWWNRESARVQEAEAKSSGGGAGPAKRRGRGRGGKKKEKS